MLDMNELVYVLKPLSIQNATGRTGHFWLCESQSKSFSTKDHIWFL